jgi:hypothetical protein
MHNPFLLPMFLIAAVFAQSDGATAPATVEGSVVNKLTGAPLKAAHVIYNRADTGGASSPISTDTDSQGHFTLQVSPGSYRLWVERSGFARQVYGALSPAGEGATLTLAAGQQLRQLTFRITPLGAISGRVLDEDGDPVQGVGIQVLRFDYATGHRQLISMAGASSNDRGEYRVFGLPAGRYLLLASPPGAPMSHPLEGGALVAEAQEAYATLYYPGVPEVDAASPVVLAEGGEFNDADFHLRRIRAITLRGRVISPLGSLAGSQLQVVLAHNEKDAASFIDRVSAAVDQSTGRFEIHGVSPGSYLLVGSQLSAGRPFAGRVPVEVSATAPAEEITLALSPALDIPGMVEWENASRGGAPKVIVRLTPSEGLAPGPEPRSWIASDGSIRLTGVTPGFWTLTVDAMAKDLWIRKATFAGNEISSGELHIREGARGQLRIVLSSEGAQISGTVTASGQPSRATVVLAPAAPEQRGYSHLYRITNSSERGLFTLKGVQPGVYKLFAFQEIAPFQWFDPEQMKLVEGLAEEISVTQGETLSHDVVAIPPETLLPSH